MLEAKATTASAISAEAGLETAAMAESEAAPGTWCVTAVVKNTCEKSKLPPGKR